RLRPHRRRAGVRPQAAGRAMGEGAGLSADAERGAAPAEPRPRRGGDRARRVPRRGPARAGEHAVSRLGAGEPPLAAAHARAARRRARGGPRGAPAAPGPHGGALRHPRLLRRGSQSVHGRLGAALPRRRARRARAAVPRGAHAARADLRQRAQPLAAGHLARLRSLRCVSRRGVDAGAVPQLRAARDRFRRLSLPGVPPDGRCHGHRPRVLAGARAPPHRGGARGRGRADGDDHVSHGAPGRARVTRRRGVDVTLWILLALVLVAIAVAFARDARLPLAGFASAGRLVRGVWIELALGFLLAGLLDVLIPRPVLSRWLGAEHVGRGVLIGWLAGLAIPGGPYVLFPVAANLLQHGAAPAPLITLLTAKTL